MLCHLVVQPKKDKNMSRRGGIKIRIIEPDPVYKNRIVTKLINRSMKGGKRSVAQKEIYRAFDIIKEKTNDDSMKTFLLAMENVRPQTEVRPRRVGGAAYQVPMLVRGPRKDSLAIRWIISAANAKPSSEFRTYAEKLSSELIDASKCEGGAYKKKVDMEKMAEANRAFAHFKW